MSECAICNRHIPARERRDRTSHEEIKRPYILEHGSVKREICPRCDDLIGQAIEMRVETAIENALKLLMEKWKPDKSLIKEAVRAEVQACDIFDADVDKLLKDYLQKARQDLCQQIVELAKTQIPKIAEDAVRKALAANNIKPPQSVIQSVRQEVTAKMQPGRLF